MDGPLIAPTGPEIFGFGCSRGLSCAARAAQAESDRAAETRGFGIAAHRAGGRMAAGEGTGSAPRCANDKRSHACHKNRDPADPERSACVP